MKRQLQSPSSTSANSFQPGMWQQPLELEEPDSPVDELPEGLGPEPLDPLGSAGGEAEELDDCGKELLCTLDPLEPDEVADEEGGRLELGAGAPELLESTELDDGVADELEEWKCELLGPTELLELDECSEEDGVPDEPLELEAEPLLEDGGNALDDDEFSPELDGMLELLESGALEAGGDDELDELLKPLNGSSLLEDELCSSLELDDELLGALLLEELLLDDEEDELDEELLLELLGNEEELLEDELELELELDELLLLLLDDDELLEEELLDEELLLELDDDDELPELLGPLLLEDELLELLLGALLLDDEEISLDDGSPLDELWPEEELDELLDHEEELLDELLEDGHGGHSSGSSQQQPMKAFRSHAPRVVCPVRKLIVTVR
jgi:hypothetical protein